jgi:RHS repeat-associated protein
LSVQSSKFDAGGLKFLFPRGREGLPFSRTTSRDSIYYLHGLDLVAQSDGTTTDYLAYDGLGSARQVLDDAGVPLLAQTFDPYGNLLARVGTGESSFGFTGEQVDANGLVYLRARYYQPGMGRFLNMDPGRQEMNPYRYSTGNPIMFTDPSGLCAGIGCAGGGDPGSASTITGFITITIRPEFVNMLGCSAGQDILDFLSGVFDQLKLDLSLQPYIATINLIANLPPLPGLGSQPYPLSAIEGWSTKHEIWVDEINDRFWTGSDWYRTGRLAGRSISREIGITLFISGAVTVGISITGDALSLLCEVATLGVCSVVAAGGVAVSTEALVTGAVAATYGGAILLSNAQNPVGGEEDGGEGTNDQSIDAPTNRRGLRQAMEREGSPPSNMSNPEAHHELPWNFREWFAKRGLNVNDTQFGRWVERSLHRSWSRAYNNEWSRFINQYPNASQAQVLEFLEELRTSGRFPSQ